jgi:hypothetical protein
MLVISQCARASPFFTIAFTTGGIDTDFHFTNLGGTCLQTRRACGDATVGQSEHSHTVFKAILLEDTLFYG